jgi:hypothetical protein
MDISGTRQIAWSAALSLLAAVGSGLLILFVLSGTLSSGVGQTIAGAIVYVLPLMALLAATEAELGRRADALRFPLDWILYVGAKLILVLAAAGIGSSLALLLGIFKKWQDLYLANRVVVVVVVIVSCLIRLYGTTRKHVGVEPQLLARGDVEALESAALRGGNGRFVEDLGATERIPSAGIDTGGIAAQVDFLADLDGFNFELGSAFGEDMERGLHDFGADSVAVRDRDGCF